MKCFSAAVASAFSLILLGFAGTAYAESLRIGGTGVALGGMVLLGAAFEEENPGTEIQVLPSLGSSGGVKALVAGAIDLAVSSRPLKDAERDTGASDQLYATTPLVLVTSRSTDADTVSMAQLVDAYSGAMTHWPSGTPIRVVLRPVSETDTQLLRGLSEDMASAVDLAHARPGLVTAINDQDNAGTLERLEGSLGLVALGQITSEKRTLRVLTFNQGTPQAGGGQDGSAALVKQLYLVKTDAIKPLASAFLSYVFSPEGQALLVKLDHTPAR